MIYLYIVKSLKEIASGLFIVAILIGCLALSPLLDIQKTKLAQIPSFENHIFQYAVMPLQVVQSWILEQQLESKDPAVQQTLKNLNDKLNLKKDKVLENFKFDLFGAVAYYLIDQPNKEFSFVFLPGSGLAKGWNSNRHYTIDEGVFYFTEILQPKEQSYFVESIKGLKFKTIELNARTQKFELRGHTYKLHWERHAFELELSANKKSKFTRLMPNGFHVSCPIALRNMPHAFFFLENIKDCSINYYGAKLNDKQALEFEFEVLLSFDNDLKIKQFLNEAQKAYPNWDWHQNFVKVNEAIYAIKRENKKQLFICSSPKNFIKNGQIKKQNSIAPIIFSGDPTLLTKFENAGWAAAVLELFPIYRGLSDFTSRTALVSTKNQSIRWELKQDYFAAGEFLKLLGSSIE